MATFRPRIHHIVHSSCEEDDEDESSVPLLSEMILEQDDAEITTSSGDDNDEKEGGRSLVVPSKADETKLVKRSVLLQRDVNSSFNISHVLRDGDDDDSSCACKEEDSTLASMSDWTDGSGLQNANVRGCHQRAAVLDTSFDEASAIYTLCGDSHLSSVDLSTIRSCYSESLVAATTTSTTTTNYMDESSHRKRLGGHQGVVVVDVDDSAKVSLTAQPQFVARGISASKQTNKKIAECFNDVDQRQGRRPRLWRLFGCLFRPSLGVSTLSPCSNNVFANENDQVVLPSSKAVDTASSQQQHQDHHHHQQQQQQGAEDQQRQWI